MSSANTILDSLSETLGRSLIYVFWLKNNKGPIIEYRKKRRIGSIIGYKLLSIFKVTSELEQCIVFYYKM